MSAKKKGRKQCWIMLENGNYVLQSSKLEDSCSSINDSFGSVPYISSNVFWGEIVARKPKLVKTSEILCNIVEIHPNTMQLCGLIIGGPVALSSSTFTFAARVWPNASLQLHKVAISSKEATLPGFNIGECVHIITPSVISIAASVELFPCLEKDKNNCLNSLLTSEHFLQYLGHFLGKAYVVTGQFINIIYFGKSFVLRVDFVSVVESTTELLKTNEKFLNHNMNESIANKLSFLSLDKSNKSNLHMTSSTPIKTISNQSDEENISNKNIEHKCHFFELNKVYMLTSNTEILVKYDKVDKDENDDLSAKNKIPLATFSDIGGLEEQIKILNDIVIAPMKNPALLKSIGMQPIHGVLLFGASGTGKSLLAKAVAGESGCSVMTILGSQIISKFIGESEAKLRTIFEDAAHQSPSIVIIDEIDSLCPRRDLTRTDAERRLVSAFSSILDELNNEAAHVIVLATTNRIEAIDPVLRRSGRFDREIEITIPTAVERAEILEKLLGKFSSNVAKSKLEIIASKCHGYVGADLLAVCKEAGLHAIKKMAQGEPGVRINVEDLEFGLNRVPPSAMRELTVQVPKVLWDDIGGNDSVKKKLKHTVEWPLKNPEGFARMGIDPPRGVLLYGPPGCSKTLTAKALATESGLNFISVKGPELFSKYVGDSEKAIRKMFSKARSAAPSIVFIDELDALAIERGSGNAVADRVLTTLLTEMDGVEHRNDVIVVAATNRPDMIDKAFLRPGRIDRILHIPLPDSACRKEIFRINFRKMPIGSDVDLETLVEKTKMFSGAEICALCREAALAALENDFDASLIASENFDAAFEIVLPQTSSETTEYYEKYEKTLRSHIK